MLSRIVVKIGSSSLTTDEGGLNLDSVAFLPGNLPGSARPAMKFSS